MPLDARLIDPAQRRSARQLGSVVQDDHQRPAMQIAKAIYANGTERVVFVVLPPTKSETCIRVRDSVRTDIIDLMAGSGVAVVDIGPCVTDFGLLADRYKADGVHLSDLAYALPNDTFKAIDGGA
jgi:hypothetical protein